MISINDLHISANPRLLFMANSITNKGRSSKSYTIEIVNDKHNDSMLSGLFSNKNNRTIRFEASYRISSITFTGWLLITGRDKWKASGVFISGNGALWEALQDKNLRDYDWSAYNHELNRTNVLASESGGSYIYDIADRGEFKQDGSLTDRVPVDITERYPALNVITIIKNIVESEGCDIARIMDIDDPLNYYLLFTQDKDIRNSKEWEKDALFEATAETNQTYTETVTGGATSPTAFELSENMVLPSETVDNGNNYNTSTGVYETTETGTYRFIAPYSFRISCDNVITDASIEIGFKRGLISSDRIFYETIDIPDADWGVDREVFLTGEIDTKYINEGGSGDVNMYVKVTGDVATSTGVDVEIRLDHVVEPDSVGWPSDKELIVSRFYNDTSRWYGEGSTVEMSNVVPDISALDFLSKVFNYLNIYAYYRPEIKTLEIAITREDEPEQTTLELVDIEQQFDERTNYWLRFATDKAGAPDDIYFDNDQGIDAEIKFDLSRTLISDCFRVFRASSVQIPILWEGGDKSPLRWEDRFSPPAWKTKANLRILQFDGRLDMTTLTPAGTYNLTFGGNATSNNENRKVIPLFSEIDIETLHRYDLELQGETLTGTCRLDFAKLKDQSLFKYPVWITGYGKYWLLEAEQINGDLFKLTLIK